MPFLTNTGFPFTEAGIAANAPRSSGVYGIYKPNTWIYVGESGDIQARLYEHLRGQSEQSGCILGYNPTGFIFELSAAANRVARERTLIAELNPVCNRA